MATKKTSKTIPKGKPPALTERITDFSRDSHAPGKWIPKKKKK